jgi:hypothetical protein
VQALGKLSQSLSDPLRRLEHDFMRGYIRAEARIAAAASGAGPHLTDLRNVWSRVAGEKHNKAVTLSREAHEARHRGNNQEAVKKALAALELSPFLEDLRSTVKVWEKAAKEEDDLPTRRPRSGSTSRARR